MAVNPAANARTVITPSRHAPIAIATLKAPRKVFAIRTTVLVCARRGIWARNATFALPVSTVTPIASLATVAVGGPYLRLVTLMENASVLPTLQGELATSAVPGFTNSLIV